MCKYITVLFLLFVVFPTIKLLNRLRSHESCGGHEVMWRTPAFSLAVFLNFNSIAKLSIQALQREVFCWLWEELVLDLFATFPSQWRCFMIAHARSVKRKIHIAKINRVQRLLDQFFPLENCWLFPCYSRKHVSCWWFHYWGKWEFTFKASALGRQNDSVYWVIFYWWLDIKKIVSLSMCYLKSDQAFHI